MFMDYAEFVKNKVSSFAPSGFSTEEDIHPQLKDFQSAIARWALRMGKSAIWADCGLGKTIMQLEWARHVCMKTGGNILIVAPLAVSSQTKKEAKRLLDLSINIAVDQSWIKPGINITNYEKLHKFDAGDFVGVVLDESSIIKNFTGKIRNQIISMFQNTPYKLCCTATPAPNDFLELGNHAEFLNVMTQNQMLSMFFINDTANTGTWRLKKHAEAQYWAWLASWAVYFRKPSDLGYSDEEFKLPPLTVHRIIVKSPHTGDGLFVEAVKTLEDQRAARKESMPSRVAAIKELVEKDHGSQWLIWCNLNDESKSLTRELSDFSFVEVAGSTKEAVKEMRMISFGMGEIPGMITKPKIAGFGMNWQECHNVAFAGISHSYEQYYQAIRRCWRFGQKHPVNVYIVLSEKEELILDNVLRKEADAIRMAEGMVLHMKDINKQNIGQEKTNDINYTKGHASGEMFDLHLGDCVETIKDKLADNSIDYSIFSPPFSSLFTYSNSPFDMGNCNSDAQFFDNFKYLADQLMRVIKPGRLVSLHLSNIPTLKSVDGFIGLRDFRGATIKMFQSVGFYYHSEVCVWKNPVVEMQRTKSLGLLHKQIKKDSSMSKMGMPDYVVTFRKPGVNAEPITHTPEDFSVDQWQEWASPVWMNINQTNTLNKMLAREKNDERHICPLQLDLIKRCVILWSNPGDLVLSPFTGIGSEGYVSLQEGRRFVGIELKESYFNVAKDNLSDVLIQTSLDMPAFNLA